MRGLLPSSLLLCALIVLNVRDECIYVFSVCLSIRPLLFCRCMVIRVMGNNESESNECLERVLGSECIWTV